MKTFTELLTMHQEELFEEIIALNLMELGYKINYTEENIAFVSPLKNQPCLVAHLDTRNENLTVLGSDVTPVESDLIITEEYIMLSPEANPKLKCLGADDRVGVKTILDLVELGYRPNILFTTDEEIGCVSSRALVTKGDKMGLENSTMFIQIDRGVHEGHWNEMVYYDYDHTHVQAIFDELDKYYTLATGSHTDVAVLGKFYNKPIVNLSASYMKEHTRNEFIKLSAYYENLDNLGKFLTWCVSQDTENWTYKEKVYVYERYTRNYTYTDLALSSFKFGENRDPISTTEEYASLEDYLDNMCSGDIIANNCKNYLRNKWKNKEDDDILNELFELDYCHDNGYTIYSIYDLQCVLNSHVRLYGFEIYEM